MYIETTVHPPRDGRVTSSQPRFFRELAADSAVVTIGQAVLDALDANYIDPELDYPTDILDTVYAAGLKTLGALTRGAKFVPVSLTGKNRVRVGPSDGSRHPGSFIGTGEDVFSESLEPDAVGRAVLEALERSVARSANSVSSASGHD